jgi:hypothetical protein
MTNPKATATPNAKDASADHATGGQGKPAVGVVAAGGAIAPKPDGLKPEARKQEGQTPEGKNEGSKADAEWLQMVVASQEVR